MSERKVLKIPTHNQPITTPIPEQDIAPQNMGGDMTSQYDNIEKQPTDNGKFGQSQFDTNFDPGVEADEETDPKRFIQQLTGKLSQSLRKYNDDNGRPDVDLDKYVAGMVVSQAIKGLSQDDVDEILDKIKADNSSKMQKQQNDKQESFENNGMEKNDSMLQSSNESTTREGDNIEEIVNGILQNVNKDKKVYRQFRTDNKGFKKKPFTSPNFN